MNFDYVSRSSDDQCNIAVYCFLSYTLRLMRRRRRRSFSYRIWIANRNKTWNAQTTKSKSIPYSSSNNWHVYDLQSDSGDVFNDNTNDGKFQKINKKFRNFLYPLLEWIRKKSIFVSPDQIYNSLTLTRITALTTVHTRKWSNNSYTIRRFPHHFLFAENLISWI